MINDSECFQVSLVRNEAVLRQDVTGTRDQGKIIPPLPCNEILISKYCKLDANSPDFSINFTL